MNVYKSCCIQYEPYGAINKNIDVLYYVIVKDLADNPNKILNKDWALKKEMEKLKKFLS